MAKPLFTEAELSAHEKALDKLQNESRKPGSDFSAYWRERTNLEKAHELEMVKRAQARETDYLNALTILVGSKGHEYVPFYQAFASSDAKTIMDKVNERDTPETRRSLFTILTALTEIPHSWATSAFVRFLRGNGKQRGAKYHGAGLFAVEYGWKGDEVTAVCKPIMNERDMYSKVVMSYTDLTEVEAEMAEKDPDYEEASTDLRFASCARWDVAFLKKLCGILESRGLAPIPTPTVKEPSGPRVPKVFKPGDVIRRATLRDLPLPAHVRIPVERLPSGMAWIEAKPENWTDSTIDQVVLRLGNAGRYRYASIGSDPNKAHEEGIFGNDKGFLDGATYVGPWAGKTVKDPLVIKFQFRKPEKGKK